MSHRKHVSMRISHLILGSLLTLAFLATFTSLAQEAPGEVYLPLVAKSWPMQPQALLLISELLPDPLGDEPAGEWIELYNAGDLAFDLTGYKIGDEEQRGGNEGMRMLPAMVLVPGQVIVVANDAAAFESAYGFPPDLELAETNPDVPTLAKYAAWANGPMELTNSSDELLLLNARDEIAGVLVWGGDPRLGMEPLSAAPTGVSWERYPPAQHSGGPGDWRKQKAPSPGQVDLMPPTPTPSATSVLETPPTPTDSPTPTEGPSPTGEPSVTSVPDQRLLISEVVYDPGGDEPEGEWIELYNAGAYTLPLYEFKVGDEETQGQGEGMLSFPPGAMIASGQVIVIANQAATFIAQHGFNPDYEMAESDPAVPDMSKYTSWSNGRVNLANSDPHDEILLLNGSDQVIDALSYGASTWAFDPPAPDVAEGHSLERYPSDTDTNTAADWRDQALPSPGQVDLTPPTATLESSLTPSPTLTPTDTSTSLPPTLTPTPTGTGEATSTPTLEPTPETGWLLISEVLYDSEGTEPAGEWIELYNAGGTALDLSDYKVGDEESSGGSEGMLQFPLGATIAPGQVIVIARQADVFTDTYHFYPDYEMTDRDPNVPDMTRYTPWASGSVSLSNTGDEVLILNAEDTLVDAISYGSSIIFLEPSIPLVDEGHTLERSPANQDTDSAVDWIDQPLPNPGQVHIPPGFVRWLIDHFQILA